MAELKELHRQAYLAAIAAERRAHPDAADLLAACNDVASKVGCDDFAASFAAAARPYVGTHPVGYLDPYGVVSGSCETLDPADATATTSSAVEQGPESTSGRPTLRPGQQVSVMIAAGDFFNLGPVLVPWLAEHGFTRMQYMLFPASKDAIELP